MSNVTLRQASTIVDKAIRKARELKLRPLTVAVLDAGGHIVAIKKEDGSSLLRPQIAMGKAWSALGIGAATRLQADRAKANPSFYAALSDMSDGRVVPVPGGVLIKNRRGVVIGAAGASGDTGDNDERCVIAGIEAARLVAD